LDAKVREAGHSRVVHNNYLLYHNVINNILSWLCQYGVT